MSRSKRRALRAMLHNEASRATRSKQTPLEKRLMHPISSNPFDRKDVMSWQATAILNVEKLTSLPSTASIAEKVACWTYVPKGQKTIDKSTPSWYSVTKTDKTDSHHAKIATARARRGKLEGESK